MLHLLTFVVLLFPSASRSQIPCNIRSYKNGIVCVCNSSYCDTVPKVVPVNPAHYLIYTSNQAGLRFDKQIGTFSSEEASKPIVIDASTEYQAIFGWGGAFSDSTGINIKSLDNAGQQKLLESYFSENGNEYSLCRVPIGGTDFSTRGYSYDDGPADPKLGHFALAHEDFSYKIPFIKKAKILNKKLLLFSSAWTAPKWMKTNKKYNGFGFLKSECHQTWADYFVKFLDFYANEGIQFWGITTGNEPNIVMLPFTKLNSVGWAPKDLGKWIVDHLGPSIRRSNHSSIKIIVHDDQTSLLPYYVETALSVENATNYIDGIAIHWYTNKFTPLTVLDVTHKHHTEKFMLSTEASIKGKSKKKPILLGSWDRGELYSRDIIQDLHHWIGGWVDWNMVLDLKGGPTYVNNTVDAPVVVNASAGEFYKQPMFYHLGHFSKFVPKDSKRIDSGTLDGHVMVVAFARPDNGTAVVILNRKNEQVSVALADKKRGTAQLNLTRKSITTLLYW